jgi:hypothetical protein
MSEGPTAAGAGRRVGSGTARLVRAWRALPHESRLAAFACLALFLTLFLPWYQVTLIAPAKTATLESASATITGWGAFSFVEAAVLLVAAGVLTLLFQRAEGRAFHLPGGDGGVITAAGLWTCLLILWRIFDKQGVTPNGPSATSSGVEWGIFIALAAAAFLAYSGSRIRAAHRPEPALPGEDGAPPGSNAAATVPPSGAAATAPASGARATVGRSSAGATAPASDAAATVRRSSAGATAPRADPSPPARRRARPPRPVSADHPAAAPAPARARASSPQTQTQTPTQTEPAPQRTPAPDRPRRRPSAAELFEPVVFEDPPTKRLGRAGAPEEDPTTRITAAEPPPAQERPVPPDEQLTIRLAAREDETVPLGRDETIPLGRDETVPLGQNETIPLGQDETIPLGQDETIPLGQDETIPLGQDETMPLGDDDTLRFDDRRNRRN